MAKNPQRDTAQPSLWHHFMKLLFVPMPAEPGAFEKFLGRHVMKGGDMR
jgi:hypothetical protein